MVMATHEVRGRLAAYLRARRALVRPQDHGFPPGARRTPGLRREEVAVLAGVSTDYYARLEQGRESNPSAQVVEALAQVLLLDDEAAAHLRGLAGPGVSRARSHPYQQVACAGLVKLMRAWPATPAMVHGHHEEVLAANPLGWALFGWLGDEHNLIRAIFSKPEAQSFYRDWPAVAATYVASLRAADIDADDEGLTELVSALSTSSPEFAAMWGRHEVVAPKTEVRQLHHPDVGDLSLLVKSFTTASAPGQHLVVYYAEPGSSDESALARLRRPPRSVGTKHARRGALLAG